MNAEIITIGDEILIGQIIDTNSAWIGQQLNPLGWEITRIITIPDTVEAITEALNLSIKRSDLVVMTGGLGPTKDDVTKRTLCEYFGVELKFHEETFKHIEALFQRFNREISQVNRDQALIPANGEALFNKFGTAPGMWFEKDGCILVSLPGVPYEMKSIITDQVIPRIEDLSSDVFEYTTMVVSGIPESIISEMIDDIESNLAPHLKIAYLPHYNFVRVRITGRGSDKEKIREEIRQLKEQIAEVMDYRVAAMEDRRIEYIVGEHLAERNQTVSFAESCTGGYMAHLITSVPGSSAYFPGSVVTYSYENKTEVLSVDADLLWSDGAVSESVVRKMATSVRVKNNTDYAVAISGIAGPGGGTKDKPVGTVWMAVCDRNSVNTKLYNLRGDRRQNIERSAHLGLELLRKKILGQI